MALEEHPCGRPHVIAKQANKRLGYKRGDVKPCDCELCGPVEARLSKWTWWGAYKHAGHYSCHKCHQMAYCRGDSTESMWCRECFLLPPLNIKRG